MKTPDMPTGQIRTARLLMPNDAKRQTTVMRLGDLVERRRKELAELTALNEWLSEQTVDAPIPQRADELLWRLLNEVGY